MQVAGWISRPYDDIFIFGFSICISIPFLISMVSVFYVTPTAQRFWSHLAILFAVLYTLFAILVYTVQLGIVLPKIHPTSGSEILTITPHSLFWTLDALAYITMGLAYCFLIPALKHQEKTYGIRTFVIAHALMTPVIAFVYFYPHFSIPLLFLGSPWMVTAGGSLWLLSVFFKRLTN